MCVSTILLIKIHPHTQDIHKVTWASTIIATHPGLQTTCSLTPTYKNTSLHMHTTCWNPWLAWIEQLVVSRPVPSASTWLDSHPLWPAKNQTTGLPNNRSPLIRGSAATEPSLKTQPPLSQRFDIQVLSTFLPYSQWTGITPDLEKLTATGYKYHNHAKGYRARLSESDGLLVPRIHKIFLVQVSNDSQETPVPHTRTPEGTQWSLF